MQTNKQGAECADCKHWVVAGEGITLESGAVLHFICPRGAACTREKHKRIAQCEPSRFERWHYVGIQKMPDEPSIELRNCPDCNSTVSRPVKQ